MGDMEINRVLSELRALQARSQVPAGGAVQKPQAAQPSGFVEEMKRAARGVNDVQMDSRRAAEDFQLGRAELAETMVKLQTASVQFRAAVEVRNRLVAAYQDIMNMPL